MCVLTIAFSASSDSSPLPSTAPVAIHFVHPIDRKFNNAIPTAANAVKPNEQFDEWNEKLAL